MKGSELRKIQEKIGYKFENPKLLRQAFTRKSYNGGCHNDVMEFLGDRILDFAVAKDFYELYGRINNKEEFSCTKKVGELNKIDCGLVKNTNLADKIMELGFTKHIQTSTKKEKTQMKTKADLFEAVLCAVAIDSGWNIDKIQQVYHAMMYSHGNLAALSGETDISQGEYIDYFETELWKHNLFNTDYSYTQDSYISRCSFILNLNGKFCKITGSGTNEHEAKCAACERGYKIIRLILCKEFAEDESYIDQLYLLQNCGFASKIEIHFEYYPALSKQDADLWRCFGCLADSDTEFCAEESEMIEAREAVCRAILCDLLGIPDDEEIEPESDSEVHGNGLLKLILSKYADVA